MPRPNDIELLRTQGDLVEQEIVRSAELTLAPILAPYAGVWVDQVLPRRIHGAVEWIDNGWMQFAGSHYTALVRSYNGYRAFEKLASVDLRTAADILDVHAMTSEFLWNLGSAVDNLGHAFEDAPISCREADGKRHITDRFQSLDAAYNRRTQAIHSRLVPVWGESGAAYFNIDHLDDSPSQTTTWTRRLTREEFVADYYERAWLEFLNEMANAWNYLRDWLRRNAGIAATAGNQGTTANVWQESHVVETPCSGPPPSNVPLSGWRGFTGLSATNAPPPDPLEL